METYLIKAAQLILSLSILVVLHEWGHYITAKWFKCRVEKFYLFFDAFDFSLFKKKIGDTVYGIGWLPLGGYVKIAGMIDESMDKEQLQQEPQPWEFRSKPAWQRLIVMLGGVTVNVILAIVIMVGILSHWGEEFLAPQDAQYGIVADSLAKKVGLQTGDIILTIDNKPIKSINAIPKMLMLDDVKTIQYQRQGQKLESSFYPGFTDDIINAKGDFALTRVPAKVGKIKEGSLADSIHLQAGDWIYRINGEEAIFTDQVKEIFEKNQNKKVEVVVIKSSGDTARIANVQIGNHKLFDFEVEDLDKLFPKYQKVDYSFFEAIPLAFTRTWERLTSYVTGFKLLKTKAGLNSTGGFIKMGSIFPAEWSWRAFWNLTAFLSIALAFMNVLPIPALDGGHALFCIYEMVTGRKPSEKFLEKAQIVGMVILLSLMVLVNGKDIVEIIINLFK